MVKKRGRPYIGESRPIKLTLPDELWTWFDETYADMKLAEAVREIIENQYEGWLLRKGGVDE